jgi:hypothetical protein
MSEHGGGSSKEAPRLVVAWYPSDIMELAVIRVALNGAKVEHLVENENYYSAGGSRLAIGDSQLRVLVREAEFERAREIIREVLQ